MALGRVVAALGLPQPGNPAQQGTRGERGECHAAVGLGSGQLLSRAGGRAGVREQCFKDHGLVLINRREQSMHLAGDT